MGDFAPVKRRAVTDCQKCGFLCLGPAIMACGHVICRKCLHERLVHKGKDALCPFCYFPVMSMEFDSEEESSNDVYALLDRLDQDVILEDLVRSFTTKCENCQCEEASFACMECQKYFCSICHLQHTEKEEFQSHECRALPCASTVASSPMSGHETCSNADKEQKDICSTTALQAHSSHATDLLQDVDDLICLDISHESQALPCASTAASAPTSERDTCINADQEQKDSCDTSVPQANSSHATNLGQEEDELLGLNKKFADATGNVQHLHRTLEEYHQSIFQSIILLSDRLLRTKAAQDVWDQQPGSTVENLQNQQKLIDAYVSRLRSPSAAILASPRSLAARLKCLSKDCRELQAVANVKQQELEKRMKMMLTVQKGIYDMLELIKKEARSYPDLNTCVPQPVLKVVPRASEDLTKYSCQISSIAITSDGRLVMADRVNSSVKIWFQLVPSDFVSVILDRKPLRLCVMDDNQVAVTGEGNLLFIVDVDLKTFSSASTEQQYCGIGAITRDRLVVTCWDIASRVDLVDRCGQLLRTVTVRGHSLHHVHVTRPSEVLVSSHFQHCVHRIDLDTGRVVETLTSPDLQQPYQVAQDAEGNVYVASWGHCCLLVRLAKDGTWRRLLDSNLFSLEYDRPAGIVLTGSRLVVTWDKLSSLPQSSLIACYNLI